MIKVSSEEIIYSAWLFKYKLSCEYLRENQLAFFTDNRVPTRVFWLARVVPVGCYLVGFGANLLL